MAVFTYSALDAEGHERQGTIDAVNMDVAIAALQRRGLVISSIEPESVKRILESKISFFDRVTNADVVMLSRQITTLFVPYECNNCDHEEEVLSPTDDYRASVAEGKDPPKRKCPKCGAGMTVLTDSFFVFLQR